MNPKTTFLSLAFSTLLAAPPCLAQAGGQSLDEAEKLVTGLVDPAAQTSGDQATPKAGSGDSIEDAVRRLLETGDVASIRLIGDAAIPVLEQVIREASVLYLLKSEAKGAKNRFGIAGNTHPIAALHAISPTRTLQLLFDLQETDPERFDLLRRSGYTPLSNEKRKIRWNISSEASKAGATQLLGRALENDAYTKTEKLNMACIMFERGMETESSRSLITANIDEALDSGLGARGFQVFLIGSENVAELPIRQGVALARSTSDGALLLALVDSPHVQVRRAALDSILGSDEASHDVSMAAVEKALDDPDSEIEASVHTLIVGRLAESSVQLSRPILIRIAEFYKRAELSQPYQASSLRSMITKSIESARTKEDLGQVEQLVKAFFDAPLDELHGKMEDYSFNNDMDSPRIAAAVYRGLAAAKHVSPGFITGFFRRNRPSSPGERGIYALDVYTGHDPASESLQLSYSKRDLQELPRERYSEALDWLGRTGANFDQCCGMDPSSWKDGAEAFRQSAYDETSPWKERVTAIIGLFSTSRANKEDGVRCGDILGKELQDLVQLDLFQKLMIIRNAEVRMPLSRHWNDAVARIFATQGVPNRVKEQLPLSPAPTALNTLQEMLNAAGAEPVTRNDFTRFEGLADVTARLAAQGNLQIPDSLLTNWIINGLALTDLVSYVLASEVEQPKNHYRDLMIQALEGCKYEEMRRLTPEILRFPGSDTAVKLMDAAAALNSAGLTTEVQTGVRRLIDLRSLKSQWAATEELPTKASAVVKLLGLLKSDSEAVRLEAMRGLGTLGAVEALPQLIGFVDAGSENEKTRALEVLSQLNERSRSASRAPK